MRAHVIGNVALDETIRVDDLPVPGASILGVELSRDLGGKGANQAVVLGRAGLSTRLVAPVGRDTRAEEIRAALVAEPVEASLVEVAGVRSDISLILMTAGGENAIVTTNEAAAGLGPDAAVAMLRGAEPGDLLVLQGNLSLASTRALLEEGRARQMRTAFNPSPVRDFFADLWPMVDIAFVNEGEAAACGGVARLLARGVGRVALTLGGRGARLISDKGDAAVAATSAEIVDTTGAGDCFMATALASATLRGVELDTAALSHAARAAALTVSRPGTMRAFPTAAEMAAILSS
ncbi:PfkB family carbohydrate kinase [Palleronia sp. KMU-117]|uniref:PfkB family carbohydrate kinase n=1 Tax=Palleronia sp. KMU-117 TaxID=3434108 RepID=UPI003D748095